MGKRRTLRRGERPGDTTDLVYETVPFWDQINDGLCSYKVINWVVYGFFSSGIRLRLSNGSTSTQRKGVCGPVMILSPPQGPDVRLPKKC